MPQQIGLPMNIQLPPTTCTICGRVLTDSASIARGIGPVCAAHNAGEFVAKDDDQQLIDEDLFTVGAVIRPNGTNVPRLISRHSPTGFAWGYGGSGPADLALNICEAFARQMGQTPDEETGNDRIGRVRLPGVQVGLDRYAATGRRAHSGPCNCRVSRTVSAGG